MDFEEEILSQWSLKGNCIFRIWLEISQNHNHRMSRIFFQISSDENFLGTLEKIIEWNMDFSMTIMLKIHLIEIYRLSLTILIFRIMKGFTLILEL